MLDVHFNLHRLALYSQGLSLSAEKPEFTWMFMTEMVLRFVMFLRFLTVRDRHASPLCADYLA